MPQELGRGDVRKMSDFKVIWYVVSLSEILACTIPLNSSGLRGEHGGKTSLDCNHG